MITPKEHPVITPFLFWYIRFKLKKHFHNIIITGTETPPDGPVLAIGNHISWWDGFFVLHLAQNTIHRKLYVMMLEDQLAANPILKYGGAFSINQGKKNMLESLHFATKLLNHPGAMVLIFPQGKLNSIYSHQFNFEKGIEYVLKNMNSSAPPSILFIANLIEYGPNPKPTLYIHYQFHKPEKLDIDTITQEYTSFYQKCLHYNINHISSL